MARTLTNLRYERTNRMLLIGAVALAAVAALLIFVALNKTSSGETTTSSAGGDVTVVVAAQNILPNTKIDAGMLETRTIASANKVAQAYTDKASVVGLTTRSLLVKGDQLAVPKLSGGAGKDQAHSAIIPADRVGFSIPVDAKSSPNQLLTAGDHVNVIAVGKVAGTPGASANISAAKTLLEDIEVLSVDDASLESTGTTDASGNAIAGEHALGSIAVNPDPSSTKPDAKTVVLSVTVPQSELLAAALDGSKIYLALMPPGATAPPLGVGVTKLPPELQ